MSRPSPLHLSRGGISLVLHSPESRLPEVLYWGPALGDRSAEELGNIERAHERPWVADSLDERVRVATVPIPADGWFGRPGIAGHRQGGDRFSPRFLAQIAKHEGDALVTTAVDSGLRVTHTLDLTPEGLIRQRLQVQNTGTDDYTLDEVNLTMPVPPRARELLDFTGRAQRERSPQRSSWQFGLREHENRRGRTGLQSTTLMIAGEPGFDFRTGEVWGVHTAWSGNHRMYAEHTFDARKILGGGELLLSGEMVLTPGEEYSSPWVYFGYGNGLDDLSSRFHSWIRSRPARRTRPRPITINTWEAVYFDQSIERMGPLADLAGSLGVERFVLDDGWFGGRRDDSSGLGDWTVSPEIWPQGLQPLIDRVHAAGMEFGLWVEPEMVNADSDLFRSHPEWVLTQPGRLPIPMRHQFVVNLAHPAAYAHVRDSLATLLDEYEIAYLKWDHNRDLSDAGDSSNGHARVHEHTLAFYRLLDELRTRYPEVEIESCSSGGGRVDLEVLERTDRIWVSDCIDPVERQDIQRWTGLLVPPELMGTHIGATKANTTGRVTTVDYRAATAVFGHFGLEWDLLEATASELAKTAEWITFHKQYRELLHSGVIVRGDDPDPSRVVHGIISPDGHEAVYSVATVASSPYLPRPLVTFPGLEPDRMFVVSLAPPSAAAFRTPWREPELTLSGRALADIGISTPELRPQEALVFVIRAA